MPKPPRLLFGPYRTPRVHIGQKVLCKIRGPSVIVGLSKGPIPWPLGRVKGNKQTMLIIYGDLEKALRREAALAVRYWCGTSSSSVVRWRRAAPRIPTSVAYLVPSVRTRNMTVQAKAPDCTGPLFAVRSAEYSRNPCPRNQQLCVRLLRS